MKVGEMLLIHWLASEIFDLRSVLQTAGYYLAKTISRIKPLGR